MRRLSTGRISRTVVGVLASLGILAAPARAEFGLHDLDFTIADSGGAPSMQAGSHPFEIDTAVHFNTEELAGYGKVSSGQPRELRVELPPGLVGSPAATPRCAEAAFTELVKVATGKLGVAAVPNCPDDAVLGVADVVGSGGELEVDQSAPVYNITPPPGVILRIGFSPQFTGAIFVDFTLKDSYPYNVIASVHSITQIARPYSSVVTLWGEPGAAAHDPQRGRCAYGLGTSCPVEIPPVAFNTLPTSCSGPLGIFFEAESWTGDLFSEGIVTHDDAEPPNPLGLNGCARLPFAPSITAKPTSKAASSQTGLDFSLDVHDEGLLNPKGLAQSVIQKAVVTLPEGMSANPSLAEGLEVCTMEDVQRETAFSEAGEGCPSASKIGTVEVETPLLEDKIIKGSLFIAKPYENYADNSLLAMYLVLQNRELGISVKQPLKVEPDPVTGQLTTVAEELPQLPFSHFRLHFREGARSPLASPDACGSYDVKALLYPWSGEAPVESSSTFQIISGPNEGPCPTGGLPPFKPGLVAGTINNRAGSFSPFYLRLFRSDSEQEITHFSIKLPPGITGKLAGIPYCSDAAIEAAKARTGPHGGQEELDNPSCPAASEIGRTLAGAGVGPSLTYAPGKVYLAGPYHGSNLSMVAITAGKVGPFDIGTVVVREGFKINPETAEVFIDSVGSDPIPHIIRGIPVHLRDIRAYVDRPEFVLNPTDCSPTSTASTVLGSGLDFVSEADDNPITVTSRFQAADCAALTFAPRLSFKLIGGTKRGKFPKLVSHLSMNGIGESGIDHASVILPHSEFIENAHFVNICTRVQFKEGAGNGANCPAGSIYGHARAVTPILSEPLEGPVMLRSNPERKLPDVVAALHNDQVDFDLVGNVDSVKGQLRTTFASAPDAPVTSFDLELEGGKKGLFVNSTNLCLKKHFVQVAFGGQNGKQFTTKPLLQVKCKGKAKRRRHRR